MKFKKGDKVLSKHFGIGKVISIGKGLDFPIHVMFCNMNETYSKEGHQYIDGFDPIEDDIIVPATKIDIYLVGIEDENTK